MIGDYILDFIKCEKKGQFIFILIHTFYPKLSLSIFPQNPKKIVTVSRKFI